MIHHKPKVIDLFCGAGGFSEGFRQAGFEIILGVDMWDTALKSHEHNHPGCEHWLTDIQNVNDLPGYELPDCDIIIGSPPCQNFSSLNVKKNICNGLELVNEFERIVEINKPKYWIWENVEFVKRFYPSASIFNSWDWGLGQRRKRAFISNFSLFRMNYKVGYWTQPLGYDGHLADAKGKSIWKHECRSGTVRTKRIRDLDTNEFLPIDEVKTLMGFSLDYHLCGGVSIQQKQLGNAVCPPIAKTIAEGIKEEI